jgi:hypothetical protein
MAELREYRRQPPASAEPLPLVSALLSWRAGELQSHLRPQLHSPAMLPLQSQHETFGAFPPNPSGLRGHLARQSSSQEQRRKDQGKAEAQLHRRGSRETRCRCCAGGHRHGRLAASRDSCRNPRATHVGIIMMDQPEILAQLRAQLSAASLLKSSWGTLRFAIRSAFEFADFLCHLHDSADIPRHRARCDAHCPGPEATLQFGRCRQ